MTDHDRMTRESTVVPSRDASRLPTANNPNKEIVESKSKSNTSTDNDVDMENESEKVDVGRK